MNIELIEQKEQAINLLFSEYENQIVSGSVKKNLLQILQRVIDNYILNVSKNTYLEDLQDDLFELIRIRNIIGNK